METNNITLWIEIITAIVAFAIIVLGGILCLLLYRNKQAKLEVENSEGENSTGKTKRKNEENSQGRGSIKKIYGIWWHNW